MRIVFLCFFALVMFVGTISPWTKAWEFYTLLTFDLIGIAWVLYLAKRGN